MSYQSVNPYITNIVPLYNVTTQGSGPSPIQTGLSNIQNLLNYNNKSLSINYITSYTPNTTLQLSNNTNINGKLSINSYSIGPDTTGFSSNTCKQFLISTATTTLKINTLIKNSLIPNFTININSINALYIDSNADVIFSNTLLAPGYNVLSDIRYKSSIQDLSNSVSTVCELKGKQYILNNKETIGFLAQDLDLVIPSAVDKKNDDKWSVNYMYIIPYLTESIKELTNRISTLESKLKVIK
jgi:hypothetical protein